MTCEVSGGLDFCFRTVATEDASTCTYVPGILFVARVIQQKVYRLFIVASACIVLQNVQPSSGPGVFSVNCHLVSTLRTAL